MQITLSLVLLLLLCIIICNSKHLDNKNIIRKHSSSITINKNNVIKKSMNAVVGIRGGDVIKGKKTKSALKSMKEIIASVKPATRCYLFVILFCTIVHVLGLPAPALFNIDKSRIYELWRPITAMAYLGGPSMSMANNLYFLIFVNILRRCYFPIHTGFFLSLYSFPYLNFLK